MKIDGSSLLASLYQTQSINSAKVGSTDSGSGSMIGSLGLDTVEISSDAYSAYAQSLNSPPAPPDFSETLGSLVDDGVITDDQASAVLSAMTSGTVDVSEGSNPLKTTLDSLVSSGTITGDQGSAIAAALAPKEDSASGIRMDKPMGPPPPPPSSVSSEEDSDEEENYLEVLLQNLVDNGTISKEQGDAVKSALSEASDSSSNSSSLLALLNGLNTSDETISLTQV